MLAILQYGLSVAAVGISVVFIALVILIGLIKVLEKCVGALTKKTEKPAAAPAAAPAPVVEEVVEEADDGELIAVIAAAIAAAMEAEAAEGETATGFVVRSIRRVNNAPAWNRAGREEQVYSRM